jgi:hypothetical protein
MSMQVTTKAIAATNQVIIPSGMGPTLPIPQPPRFTGFFVRST